MFTYKRNKQKDWLVVLVVLIMLTIVSIFVTSIIFQLKAKGTVQLSFNEKYTESDLKALDGRQVSIKGFSNQRTTVDFEDGYFSSTPLDISVSTDISNGLVDIYYKDVVDEQTIQFSARPLILYGVFRYDDIVDRYGNNFSFYIEDVVFEEYDVTESDSYELQRYVDLFNNGFTNRFESVLNTVYEGINEGSSLNYYLFSNEDNNLVSGYPEIQEFCVSLQDIVDYYNFSLQNGNTEISSTCIQFLEELYLDYYETYCGSVIL